MAGPISDRPTHPDGSLSNNVWAISQWAEADAKWNDALISLPRYPIQGDHSFKEGELYEFRKDFRFEHTPKQGVLTTFVIPITDELESHLVTRQHILKVGDKIHVVFSCDSYRKYFIMSDGRIDEISIEELEKLSKYKTL